jgi:hypothetical protein
MKELKLQLEELDATHLRAQLYAAPAATRRQARVSVQQPKNTIV